jgi:hypothetical protein
MRRALGTTVILLGAALLVPTASSALDGPQTEYRAKVEPICEAEGEAKERIAGSGPHRVPARNADAAVRDRGRRLVRQSKALGQALARLRSVPRPEEDAARLAKWLGLISEQVRRLRMAGKAAIDGEPARAQKLVNQFTNASPKANNLVVAYEFRHCIFEESGFTS